MDARDQLILGIGRILMRVGDLSAFDTPAHLASYAGICPQQRLLGVSINNSGPNRGGNKTLKNALWHCAFASIKNHERSRHYYDRQRVEGKHHHAAIMCLARRKCNVIFALISEADIRLLPMPHPEPSRKTDAQSPAQPKN